MHRVSIRQATLLNTPKYALTMSCQVVKHSADQTNTLCSAEHGDTSGVKCRLLWRRVGLYYLTSIIINPDS